MSVMIGNAIQKQREAKGWSQRQLASRAGVGVMSICRIEADEQSPTISTLWRISEALDVHVTDLIEEKRSG